MKFPPRLRIQRTARGLRWSGWEAAETTPLFDCMQSYQPQSLDAYLQSFYRLAQGSLWQPTPEEQLRQAVDQLGQRLTSLIPVSVQAWMLKRHHLVLEAADASIPWELAHLGGTVLWKRSNLRRSPFPTEEEATSLQTPLRCLWVADSDGTLPFCQDRALLWRKRLKDLVHIDIVSGAEAGLPQLVRRLNTHPYQVLVWNATHLSYGTPSQSHIWLYDQALGVEAWRRAVKDRLPPVVILNWHSAPELGDDQLRCLQVDEWAIVLQEMGARAVLGAAWDHADLDSLWLEALADFCRGASFLNSLRLVRLRNQSKSCADAIRVYAGSDFSITHQHQKPSGKKR